ncbi:MAG: hypothetical protein KKG89_19595 [Alphaproteobacteria bacterium]|nr:hypothetical protein [Alphaproteobacteria bacterium]
MNWSMPRPVLQVVATGLVAACLGAFALGAITAPARSRLPGERLDGITGQVLEAQDATPLTDERIVGATQDKEELTPEEQAALDAVKKAKAEAAALAKAEAEKGAPAGPESAPVIAPPPPAVAAEAAPAPPPPKVEEPPF